MEALDAIRLRLEEDLLRIKEEELELEDECECPYLFCYSAV
jgi:hypothetical protein